MKCPFNVDMRAKKPLSLGFVALLLLSMAISVTATPWDGVPDDPTDAQAIWVDPKNTTGLALDGVFTVDILINVTDPPGLGTGLYGFQYKLKWNSTVLEAVEIQTHTDNVPTGDLLPGWTSVYVAANDTGPISGSSSGWGNHSYAVAAISGVAFTGVDSLCTYKFRVLWQPGESEPDYIGLLDLYDDILVDDTAAEIPHTTVDGEYWVLAKVKPVADFTWSPTAPKVGETVTFDASLSEPNGGSIESYAWNFSDGTSIVTETDPITTHAYTAIGTHNVTLTVTDSEGLSNSTTKSITIAKATSTISIFASPTTVKVDKDTTISGSITPARVGVTVTIYYRLSGEATWNTTTVTTNSTGGYSYTWSSSVAGDYEFKASWPGDANTVGDESSTITVTVEEAAAPPSYLLYVAIVIIIIIVAAIAFYFLRKKS